MEQQPPKKTKKELERELELIKDEMRSILAFFDQNPRKGDEEKTNRWKELSRLHSILLNEWIHAKSGVDWFALTKLASFPKLAILGDWWIQDNGDVAFCDSSVVDDDHDYVVVRYIQGKYVDDEFDKGGDVDWEGFEKKVNETAFRKAHSSAPSKKAKAQLLQELKNTNPHGLNRWGRQELVDRGMTYDEIAIASRSRNSDPKGYAIRKLGWKRVVGNTIQTHRLTGEDLSVIAHGIAKIENDGGEAGLDKETFTIEIVSSGKMCYNVPLDVIQSRDPARVVMEHSLSNEY